MSSARQGGRSRPRGASRNPPTALAENNPRRENRKPRASTNGSTASVNGRGGPRGLASGRGNATPRGNKIQGARQGASSSLGAPSPLKPASASGNGIQAAKPNEAPDERFQRLKRNRIKEREWQIENGFMADPDVPRALSEAITLVGTCQDMCPEYERAERIAQRDVWQLEKDPATLELSFNSQKEDESRMVKKFRRPAAGIEEQLPSDLRPPEVLRRTLDFLIDEVIGQAKHLEDVYKFVWDRTRGIRNDFSVQNIKDAPQVRIAIDCFERIVRFHLLTLHQVGSRLREATGEYNHQQDMEQCGKTLVSLIAYYDLIRERYRSPNEAEFRAYWIIMRIPRDSGANMEARVQKWPKEMLSHPRVQRALQIHAAACSAADPNPRANNKSQVIAQQNWTRFWKLVGSTQTSYLMACLAEIFFNVVRVPAIHAITQSYYRGYTRTVDDWTLEDLREELALDDEEDVREFLETFGFHIEQRSDGKDFLEFKDAKTRGFPNPIKPIRFSWFSHDLVEFKRFGRTFPAILNGLSVKTAREKGQIEEEEEESLFVSDEEQVSDAELEATSQPKPSEFNPTANPFQRQILPPLESEKPNSPFNPFGASVKLPSSDQPSPFNQLGGLVKPTSLNGPSSTLFSKPQPGNIENTAAAPYNPFGSSSQSAGQPSSAPSPFGSVTAPATPNPFGISASSTQTPLVNPFGPKPSATLPTAEPTVSTTTSAVSTPPLFASADFKSLAGSPNLGPSLFTSRTSTITQPTPSNTQESPFVSAGTLQSATNSSPSTFGFTTKSSSGQSALPQLATPQQSLPSLFQPSSTPPTSTAGLVQVSDEAAKSVLQQAPQQGMFRFPPTSPASPALQQPTPLPAQQPTGGSLFKFLTEAKHDETPQPKQAPSTPSLSPFKSPDSDSPLAQPGPSQAQPAATSSGSATAKPPSPLRPTPKKQVRFATADESASHSAPGPSSLSFTNPTAPPSQFQPRTEPVQLPAVQGLTNGSARAARKEQGLDYIATQLLMDAECGFLRQYIEYSVAPMFEEAMKDREAELARIEADAFRWKSLARRYWQTWRRISSVLRHRREGRSRRARLATEKMERARKRKEQEQQRLATQDYHEAMAEFEAVTGKAQSSYDKSVNKSSQVTNAASIEELALLNRSSRVSTGKNQHKRTMTEPAISAASHSRRPHSQSRGEQTSRDSRRSSILSSSFLSGEPLRESINSSSLRGRLSTVTSTYFRLKARGLENISDAYIERTSRKRIRASDGHESSLLSPPSTASPPEHIVAKSSPPRSYPIYRSLTGKRHAADMLEHRYTPEASPPLKRKPRNEPVDEDEDLFARVRAVREAMDESISFYREETKKVEEELSRSSSAQGSSTNVLQPGAGSPDQLFQSQAFPPRNYFQQSQQQQQLTQSERPKYWSRVSKFIPREEYGLGPASKRVRLDRRSSPERDQRHPLESSAVRQVMTNGNGHTWNDGVEEEIKDGEDEEEYDEEEYDEEEDYDEEDDESEDGHVAPEALKGGNSVDDAIEL